MIFASFLEKATSKTAEPMCTLAFWTSLLLQPSNDFVQLTSRCLESATETSGDFKVFMHLHVIKHIVFAQSNRMICVDILWSTVDWYQHCSQHKAPTINKSTEILNILMICHIVRSAQCQCHNTHSKSLLKCDSLCEFRESQFVFTTSILISVLSSKWNSKS